MDTPSYSCSLKDALHDRCENGHFYIVRRPELNNATLVRCAAASSTAVRDSTQPSRGQRREYNLQQCQQAWHAVIFVTTGGVSRRERTRRSGPSTKKSVVVELLPSQAAVMGVSIVVSAAFSGCADPRLLLPCEIQRWQPSRPRCRRGSKDDPRRCLVRCKAPEHAALVRALELTSVDGMMLGHARTLRTDLAIRPLGPDHAGLSNPASTQRDVSHNLL